MILRRKFIGDSIVSDKPIYLSEQKSTEDLFSRMMSPDREQCDSFKSLKVEVAFVNRMFVIYKPTGLTPEGYHKTPEILAHIRVNDFYASAQHGTEVEIEDLSTHEVMKLGYIPQRLFKYDVFGLVAPRQRLVWEATLLHGSIKRSMSFMLLFKERSAADNFSHSVTNIVTPSKFRELYPAVPLTLNQIN